MFMRLHAGESVKLHPLLGDGHVLDLLLDLADDLLAPALGPLDRSCGFTGCLRWAVETSRSKSISASISDSCPVKMEKSPVVIFHLVLFNSVACPVEQGNAVAGRQSE